MKLQQLIDAVPAIRKISDAELNIKTLYAVKMMINKTEKHLRFFDESKQKIIDDCGKFEDGVFVANDGKAEEFNRRMRELLDLEIDDDFKLVKISADENLKLSYNDLCRLEGLIEIEFEEV